VITVSAETTKLDKLFHIGITRLAKFYFLKFHSDSDAEAV